VNAVYVINITRAAHALRIAAVLQMYLLLNTNAMKGFVKAVINPSVETVIRLVGATYKKILQEENNNDELRRVRAVKKE